MSVPTTMPSAVNLTLQRRVIAVRTSRPDVDLKLPERSLCADDVTALHRLDKRLEIVLRRRGDCRRRGRRRRRRTVGSGRWRHGCLKRAQCGLRAADVTALHCLHERLKAAPVRVALWFARTRDRRRRITSLRLPHRANARNTSDFGGCVCAAHPVDTHLPPRIWKDRMR